MRTIHDKLVTALLIIGCERADYKYSTKYTVLTRPNRFKIDQKTGNLVFGSAVEQPSYYFVGRNGSLRRGRNATNSFAISEDIKRTLINQSTAKSDDLI